MKNKFFIFLSLFLTTVFAGVSFGVGSWYFNNNPSSAVCNYDLNESGSTHKSKVDDIAENYTFGANTADDDYYDVYFFPQPILAKYKNITKSDLSSPSSKINIKTATYTYTNVQYNTGRQTAYASGTIEYDSEWDEITRNSSISLSANSYSSPIDLYKNNKQTVTVTHYTVTPTGVSISYDYWNNNITATLKSTTSKGTSSTQEISIFQDDSYGYWGYRTPTKNSEAGGLSEDKGEKGTFPEFNKKTGDGTDGTEYGYYRIPNVHHQLSTKDFEAIPCCFSTQSDGTYAGWYKYFVGFTYDQTTAQENSIEKSKLPAASKLFNLTNSLKSIYEASGSNTITENGTTKKVIYLYAIYTAGTNEGSPNVLSAHLKKEGDYDNPAVFQWMFLPNEYTANDSTRSKNNYLELSNVYVTNSNTVFEGKHTNIFYTSNDKDYILEIKPYADSGYTVDTWDQKNTYNLSELLKNVTQNAFYNIYIYYSQQYYQQYYQQSDDTWKLTESNTNYQTVNTDLLQKKHIVNTATKENYTTDSKNNHNKTEKASYKIYVERVYDYYVVGNVAGYSAYNNSGDLQLRLNSTSTTYDETNNTSTEVYESSDILFSNSDVTTFGINYGEDYAIDGTFLVSDGNAPTNMDSNSITGSEYKVGNGIYNASHNLAYYGTTDDSTWGSYNAFTVEKKALEAVSDSEEDALETIPQIKLSAAGRYRIRIKVTYATGEPSATNSNAGKPTKIEISIAYIESYFIEIHLKDPTNTQQTGTGDFNFVDHSEYIYRASFSKSNNKGDIVCDGDDKVFHSKNVGDAVSLQDIMGNTNYSSYGDALFDHVAGSRIRYYKNGDKYVFTTDNGITNQKQFIVNKNYIFYFANSSGASNTSTSGTCK